MFSLNRTFLALLYFLALALTLALGKQLRPFQSKSKPSSKTGFYQVPKGSNFGSAPFSLVEEPGTQEAIYTY